MYTHAFDTTTIKKQGLWAGAKQLWRARWTGWDSVLGSGLMREELCARLGVRAHVLMYIYMCVKYIFSIIILTCLRASVCMHGLMRLVH